MISDIATWANTYQPTFDDVFARVTNGSIPESIPAMEDAIEIAWQDWIDNNTQGIEVPAPYATSGTTSKPLLTPLKFPNPGTPVTVATIIAAAWATYMSAITYPPPPPAPPFLVITNCIPNSGTVVSGQLTLQSMLIAEFAIVPPSLAGAPAKYTNIATAFWTNTSGPVQQVLLIGLSLTIPPVPLIMPFPIT